MFKFKKNKLEKFNDYNNFINKGNEQLKVKELFKKKHQISYSGMFAFNSKIYGIALVLMSIHALVYFYYNDHSYYEMVTLSNGETIKYISLDNKVKNPYINGAFERKLDTKESNIILANLNFIGEGFFDKEDSSLIGIKGVIDDINVIVCKSNYFKINIPRVTKHMKHQYTINDVQIRAWYYDIRNNIKNNNDFVFCVYFKLGDKDIYLEKTLDDFTDSINQIRIGELVLKLIELDGIYFRSIQY